MLSSKLFLILVSIDLDTFSILPPYVLGSRNVPVPMPTTLIGALLYPAMKDKYGDYELGYNEIYEEAQKLGIHYVTFRAAPYVTITTLERAFSIMYQKPNRLKLLECINKCLDVISIALNYGITSIKKEEVELFKEFVKKYLNRSPDEDKNCNCIKLLEENILNIMFAVTSRGITVYGDTSYIAYITSNKEIVKYAWQIVRIGRKEDLAVVRDVRVIKLDDLKPLESISFNTRFYVLKGLVKEASAGASLWKMMVYLNGHVREDDVYVPRGLLHRLHSMNITVDPDHSIVYGININNNERDFVTIPKEVIGSA